MTDENNEITPESSNEKVEEVKNTSKKEANSITGFY